MGILEIHFHDSEFSWSVNPGIGKERSLSFGIGSKSKSESGSNSKGKSGRRSSSATGRGGSSERGRPATGSKLRPLAVLGLVVGGAIAFNRLRSRRRRTREKAKSESSSPGRRLSLFRGK